MSDQFALIDARGRAAGAALRDATLFRVLPDLPTPKRHGWVRLAIVAALVIAVVVGLVAVAGRDAAPVDERDPKNLRYVIDDLPDGWSILSRTDATHAATDPLPGMFLSLYGTSGDPTAPVVLLRWSSPDSPDGQSSVGSGFAGLGQSTDVEEFTVGDWAAACGTDADGRVQCRVETDQGFVQFAARRFPLETVRSMVSSLTFEGGLPQLAVTSLPSGVAPLYAGPLGVYFTAGAPDTGRASAIRLTGPASAAAVLTASWADDTDLAYLGLDTGWESTTMAGRPVFRQAVHEGDETIVWVDDGRTFWLHLTNAPDGLSERFVASVRPATDTAWAALHANEVDTSGTSVTAGTAPVESEPATADPVPTLDPDTTITDVDAPMTIKAISDHAVEVSARDATGSDGTTTVTVSHVVDTYDVRGVEGGAFITRAPLSEIVLQFVPSSGSTGLFALSEDPDAVELVVTASGGIRVHTPLSPLFEGVPGRFAMVAKGLERFVNAQVLAADGTVLAEIPAYGI